MRVSWEGDGRSVARFKAYFFAASWSSRCCYCCGPRRRVSVWKAQALSFFGLLVFFCLLRPCAWLSLRPHESIDLLALRSADEHFFIGFTTRPLLTLLSASWSAWLRAACSQFYAQLLLFPLSREQRLDWLHEQLGLWLYAQFLLAPLSHERRLPQASAQFLPGHSSCAVACFHSRQFPLDKDHKCYDLTRYRPKQGRRAVGWSRGYSRALDELTTKKHYLRGEGPCTDTVLPSDKRCKCSRVIVLILD